MTMENRRPSRPPPSSGVAEEVPRVGRNIGSKPNAADSIGVRRSSVAEDQRNLVTWEPGKRDRADEFDLNRGSSERFHRNPEAYGVTRTTSSDEPQWPLLRNGSYDRYAPAR